MTASSADSPRWLGLAIIIVFEHWRPGFPRVFENEEMEVWRYEPSADHHWRSTSHGRPIGTTSHLAQVTARMRDF